MRKNYRILLETEKMVHQNFEPQEYEVHCTEEELPFKAASVLADWAYMGDWINKGHDVFTITVFDADEGTQVIGLSGITVEDLDDLNGLAEELSGFSSSSEKEATTRRRAQEKNEYQEYWATVNGIAEDIRDEWLEDNSLDVNDMVWESVDGSQYIIYYSKNLTVLEHSDNDDAISDAGVDIDTSRGWRHILTQVAFYAMERDVYDALDNLGFDGQGFEVEEDDEDDEDWDEEEE